MMSEKQAQKIQDLPVPEQTLTTEETAEAKGGTWGMNRPQPATTMVSLPSVDFTPTTGEYTGTTRST
jgi:hypothetical protein